MTSTAMAIVSRGLAVHRSRMVERPSESTPITGRQRYDPYHERCPVHTVWQLWHRYAEEESPLTSTAAEDSMAEGRLMQDAIRVAIIHRNRLFREGLAFALSQQHDITVVTCSDEPCHALAEIGRLCPHVMILDFSQQGRNGLQEARQFHEACPAAKLLMMGLTESESDVLACIEAGAAGLLQREASLEELLQSIRAVVAGEALCPPKIVSLLFSQIAAGAHTRTRVQLSKLPHLPTSRDKCSP
jgi:DNA-binding NarL/FixJ family response regulator